MLPEITPAFPVDSAGVFLVFSAAELFVATSFRLLVVLDSSGIRLHLLLSSPKPQIPSACQLTGRRLRVFEPLFNASSKMCSCEAVQADAYLPAI